MKNRNCPNCGAVIEIDGDKCPYCGTSYFDISAMPINEPFFLKLNAGTRERPNIIVQKVVLYEAAITHKLAYETATLYADDAPAFSKRFYMGTTTDYELRFRGVGEMTVSRNE